MQQKWDPKRSGVLIQFYFNSGGKQRVNLNSQELGGND